MGKTKKLIFVFICMGVFIFSGCNQVIESTADELRFNKWRAENENRTQIILSFDLNQAEMEFIGADDDSSGAISGPCIVSDSGFIITDTSMGEIFYFTYNISGDNVTVVYQDKEIEFSKVIVNEEESEGSVV